jgi:hypothetical protein
LQLEQTASISSATRDDGTDTRGAVYVYAILFASVALTFLLLSAWSTGEDAGPQGTLTAAHPNQAQAFDVRQ